MIGDRGVPNFSFSAYTKQTKDLTVKCSELLSVFFANCTIVGNYYRQYYYHADKMPKKCGLLVGEKLAMCFTESNFLIRYVKGGQHPPPTHGC